MFKSIYRSKYFIVVVLATLIALTLMILEVTAPEEEVYLEYSSLSSFDAKEVIDNLSTEEYAEYLTYVETGISTYIDQNVLSLNSPTVTNGNSTKDLLVDYVNEIYNIEINLLDDDTNITDSQIHLTTEANRYDEFYYTSDAAGRAYLNAYSQSEIPRNIFEKMYSGEEFEIIATTQVWDYLNYIFEDTSNIKIADLNGDSNNDINDLLADESELYNYLVDENYSDAIVFALSTNLHFQHRLAYKVLFYDEFYHDTVFDNQFMYIGTNSSENYELLQQLFNSSWLTGFKSFVERNVMPDIIDYMIDLSPLNSDGKLSTYIDNLDTIYVGLYESYYPYAYVVNGEFQGYHVELFRFFENILSSYDISIKFVSYGDNDYTHADNYIYTNYYDRLEFEDEFIISSYYDDNYYQIYSRNDSRAYQSLSEITGTIAIPEYLSDFTYLFDIFSDDDIVTCQQPEDCKSKLDSGEVDYAIISTLNYNYFTQYSENKYYINMTLQNIVFEGYYAINNNDENATYLLKLLDFLYATADHDALLEEVTLTYEQYIAAYNDLLVYKNSTNIIIYVYIIILAITTITFIIENRREKYFASKQLDRLIDVTSIGVMSFHMKKEVFDYYLNNPTYNVFEFDLNENFINALEIENYKYNLEKDTYTISESTFFNTIKSFTFKDGIARPFTNDEQPTAKKLLSLCDAGNITIEHSSTKSGISKFYKYSISAEEKGGQFHISGLALDTTSINNQNIVLRELAYQDPLTNLGNTTKLQFDFEQEDFKHYITININNFKFFNESYSAQFADKILQKLATNMNEVLTGYSKAYRIVADNFLIMSKNPNTKELEELISKVHKACTSLRFEEEDEYINLDLYYTISEFDKSKYADYTQFSLEMTIKNYLGKKNAGYYVDKKEQEHYAFQQKLQSEIFKLKNFDDFEIYLQPKVNPFNNKCVGAESLIRWNHPEYGRIAPFDFISKFELLGKIDLLDNFVLNETCKTFNELKEQGLINDSFSISFNLSGFSVTEREFSKEIKKALGKHGVDYKNIGIEILENIDVQKHKPIIDKFQELHELGMDISIDDYGSGYSNVYTVTLLPFTKLKFDKSLVDDIDTDEEKRKLFQDLVKMNRALGHDILVEGVEKEDQVEIVKKQNVHEIQGYFYSRPLQLKDFVEYIKLNKE